MIAIMNIDKREKNFDSFKFGSIIFFIYLEIFFYLFIV